MSASVTALKKNRTTPGVYVTEFAAFPPSIVGVATAVPIFVGYVQVAIDPTTKKQLYGQAIQLNSMADYYTYFGYGYDTKYFVREVGSVASPPTPDVYDFEADSAQTGSPATIVTDQFVVTSASSGDDFTYRFNLYMAMQLFFANGGGTCYVVAVNNYWGTKSTQITTDVSATPTPIKAQELLDGLAVANDVRGVTMLVVPDACLLSVTDYGKVACAMLLQASTLQDRVAILDLPGAVDPTEWTKDGLSTQADAFYTAIAPAAGYIYGYSYGAAYAPAVESSVLTLSDVDYTNLKGDDASTIWMNNLLTTQALALYPDVTGGSPPSAQHSAQFDQVSMRIAAAFPVPQSNLATSTESARVGYTTGSPALCVSLPDTTGKVAEPTTPAAIVSLDQYLANAVPLLPQIESLLVAKLNVAPPSGIMAGIWTLNDANRGVWNAPANLSLADVIAPKVILTDADQGAYNVPLNGMAIDILRAMINRGTVVWGARTLDGNSPDYRFIQVRRTLNYIEQSIKLALAQFVFAANDAGTWTTVTAAISNFLTQFWQSGGLMGNKASDAFTVQCGVPTTMTGQDVLNGYMIVNVTVQLIHPAEFIELTFTQTMQNS